MMQNTTSVSKKGDPGRPEPGGLRFRDRLSETVRRMGRGMRRRRTSKPPDLVVVPYGQPVPPPSSARESQSSVRSSGSYSAGRGSLSLGKSTCPTSPFIVGSCRRSLPRGDKDDSEQATTLKIQTWPKMNKKLPSLHDSPGKANVMPTHDTEKNPRMDSVLELVHIDPAEHRPQTRTHGAKTTPPERNWADNYPSQSSRLPSNSTEFVQAWEQKLLPELVRILDSNVKGAYHINVRRGSAQGDRIIDVMSRGNGAKHVSSLLESARDEMLKNLDTETVFEFRGGELERSCKGRQGSQASAKSDGSLDLPQNPWFYPTPVMGDSAGSDARGCSGSVTLGPSVLIDGKTYRLVNWHLFDDRDGDGAGEYYGWSERKPARDLHVVHPSPDDFRTTSSRQREAPSRDRPMMVGKVVAYSGPMNRTHRRPRSMRRLAVNNADIRTVTDWALCETNQTETANRIRDVGMAVGDAADSAPLDYTITNTADPTPGGNMIIAAGRSSGCTYGQICEVPGFSSLGDGTHTLNWAVESVNRSDPRWGVGIGIAGDSGAPIIDAETHELLGQVWGRNVYDDNPAQPRIAYFTAMSDIFDDIEERWPDPVQCLRPTLPGGGAATGDSTGDRNPAIQGSLGAVRNLLDEQVSVAERSGARAIILAPGYGSASISHANTWPLLGQTVQV